MMTCKANSMDALKIEIAFKNDRNLKHTLCVINELKPLKDRCHGPLMFCLSVDPQPGLLSVCLSVWSLVT